MNISTLLKLKLTYRSEDTDGAWKDSLCESLNERFILGQGENNNFIVMNQEHRELLVGHCVMNNITARFYEKDNPSMPRMYALVYQ